MRRRALVGAAAGAALLPLALQASPRLREMQIIPVPALKLRIWIENQPPWEGSLHADPQQPGFIVQSPDNYHPPTVMSYWSRPAERVADAVFEQVAQSAIQRASQNFGLDLGNARAVTKLPASYGDLTGFEGQFVGQVEGQAMDVRIFVGQKSGRFPVVMSVYTLQGKLTQLSEVIRRGWGNVSYLP